ncbi:SPOR domain-containing protein [Sphingomonas jaspsi]|uniref:SPOR domain-containing protein n=1 Tax=Sphingomonas jaspsi TaxID=392409 RepID=UPI0004B75FBE|nr:SPOR domain-containing protein [Sphingomonas jaspsi]
MTKTNRLGAKLAAASLIALATACSGPMDHASRDGRLDGKADASKIGLATRAQVALQSNDVAGATALAEQAVEASPNDASFRALLGNCYLAAGRFQSAEAAYRDSLTLVANQPKVILKLALVQTALGRGNEASSLLYQAQQVIDPTDLGLALALAGNSDAAIQVLESAARQVGAESRTRQNLALAYAFSGRWSEARVVAAQDLPAAQVDARIQEWMALAKPSRQSDQVAAFIGISPIAGDPGQPVRLALNKSAEDVRYASSEPLPSTAVTEGLTSTAAVEVPEAQPYQPEPAAVVAAAEPVAAPVAEPVPAEAPAPLAYAEAAPVAPVAPALSPSSIRVKETVASLRRAALQANARNSRVVVQLGAYTNRAGVQLAWKKAAAKYALLKGYTPVSAKFASANGTFYRLSVKGFASDREARGFCSKLQASGRACFVRSTAGDAPVRFASR